ncbi:MAG: hypothetical protein ABL903_15835, partial [Methylococcales bacterium]
SIRTMPHHHNSILAIAYDSLISSSLSTGIINCLRSLSHENFNVANDAYLTMRDYKNSGYIIQYAIANTSTDALQHLNRLL